jgi:hypothetical protein
MLRWRGRRATTDLDKRNPGMVIFLRRLTIRGQPKKWGDKSERLLTKRATHPIDPFPPDDDSMVNGGLLITKRPLDGC